MSKRERIIALTIFVFAFSQVLLSQETTVPAEDPLQQRVPRVELRDQSVVDGIAMVSRGTSFGVTVEYPLGATISEPAPPLKTFTVTLEPGAISNLLDRLCALDPTFTWVRYENTLNVLPRSLANDRNYFLNRKIDELTFQSVQAADDAVMKMVDQLPGAREQIAVMQVGASLNFADPWSTTLKNISVRQVFDRISKQLGPTYGWQFSGAQDFRILIFHEALLPKPSRNRQKQSKNSGAR